MAMNVIGVVAKPPTRHQARQPDEHGKPRFFWSFRLVDNQGSTRESPGNQMWYDVISFDMPDADFQRVVQPRALIEVGGHLKVEAYQKRDGSYEAAAKLTAKSIRPFVSRNPQPR